MLGFNNDVFVVPTLQMINNGTIYLDQLTTKSRELKITKTNIQKVRVPVLTVEVIPGPDSNATALSFKWNVTAEDKRNMAV